MENHGSDTDLDKIKQRDRKKKAFKRNNETLRMNQCRFTQRVKKCNDKGL